MQLWEWRKGDVVLQVFQKSFSRDEWPAIQITNDGQLACQAVNGAINCYSLTDPAAGDPLLSHMLCCISWLLSCLIPYVAGYLIEK